MFNIKNITDGQIVCTLANGNTLRLDKSAVVAIKEDEITDYLRNLESRGFIVISKIESKPKNVDSQKTKKSTKTKEG